MQYPKFIYGTAWKEDHTERCVKEAIDAGFRAFDTANQRKHYFEAGVGKALQGAMESGSVKREELFIQTKFTFINGQDHRLPYDAKAVIYNQVMQSFQSSLEHLGCSYLDSYILHGPASSRGLKEPDREAWRAMESLYKEGKVKAIGVSNVSLEQLEAFFNEGTVKPSFVQNRCYAATGWDREVRRFCSKSGIKYQGFSLLTANGQIARNPAFPSLIEKYRCTPPQLVFAFSVAAGMIPLTGTTSLKHMKEDLEALALSILPEDLNILENIGLT